LVVSVAVTTVPFLMSVLTLGLLGSCPTFASSVGAFGPATCERPRAPRRRRGPGTSGRCAGIDGSIPAACTASHRVL
jgi:hypothetical protein